MQNVSALKDRLEEQLVFELHKDGSSAYINLTVRGLYRYALKAITSEANKAVTSTSLPAVIDEELVPEIQDPPEPASSAGTHSFQKDCQLPNKSAKESSRTNVSEPVTYRERLGAYLHPRDMRRLVTPFSTSNEPELIVRRHVMLLNFDPLRAIILRDRLLVLVPNGADSLLVNLERRVRGGTQEQEDSIFGWTPEAALPVSVSDIGDSQHSAKRSSNSRLGFLKRLEVGVSKNFDHSHASSSLHPRFKESDETENLGDVDQHSDVPDEWDELEAREWVNLPFELQCADAVLNVVGSILSDDTYALQKSAGKNMDELLRGHSLADDPLTIIRVVKDAVQLMTKRVQGFVQSLNRTLDEDEDMALMNLSRLLTHPERFIQPVPQSVLEEESDEPELILEANLQIAFTLLNYLDLVQGQINTAKEFLDQKQDATRNRLLFANMMISVFSLCTTLASLVGSFMGMNLHNGLETDDNAFRQVTYGTIAGAFATCIFIMSVLWFSGTIPRTATAGRTVAV